MEPTIAGAEAPSTRSAATQLTLLAGAILLVGIIVMAWAAPSSYQVYKLFHVLAAVIWVGGGSALMLRGIMAERSNDAGEIAVLAQQGGWLGTRIFTPASFVTLAMGIAMMEKASWGWDHFWVIAALIGWALTTVTGIFVLSPRVNRLGQTISEHGPTSAEAQGEIKKILLVLRFDAVLLLLVVVDMVAKPFA